ncbi:hypothetical protein SCALM49S_08392 [Streptomyces californicus]
MRLSRASGVAAMDRSAPAPTGLNGSAWAAPSTRKRYVTRSRAGMRTSAYQQSVSAQRRSGTGGDQLSKSSTPSEPRHRKRARQPPSAATVAGARTAAQNASEPGRSASPNAVKGLSPPARSVTGRMGDSS